ncbi:hypothetical protein ACTXT7_009935 [Hymenolepis weldensis]
MSLHTDRPLSCNTHSLFDRCAHQPAIRLIIMDVSSHLISSSTQTHTPSPPSISDSLNKTPLLLMEIYNTY